MGKLCERDDELWVLSDYDSGVDFVCIHYEPSLGIIIDVWCNDPGVPHSVNAFIYRHYDQIKQMSINEARGWLRTIAELDRWEELV